MHLQMNLDDELVAELDKRVGKGDRSAFVSRLLCRALEDERRWDRILSAVGGSSDRDHGWNRELAASRRD